jgi:hypothetical protein
MALQNDHVESDEELPTKTKSFFANAAETFDAAFYAKVNDDIYINVGMSIGFVALLVCFLLRNFIQPVIIPDVPNTCCFDQT